MNKPKIKICGLVSVEDAKIVNGYPVDFAGFVLYFPKSRRNVALEKAIDIMKILKNSVSKVAVTVSPSQEQIICIQDAGFDFIQIHGKLEDAMLDRIEIPVIRAVNVETNVDVGNLKLLFEHPKIHYVAFDGRKPGSGETFDWEFLKNFVDQSEKIMLAGGLNSENVSQAIDLIHPDIVDVSTGVENISGIGKDKEKVRQFVKAVKR